MSKLRNLFVVVMVALLCGCGTTRTVPITGRKQSLLVSDSEVLSLSNQQYQQYMQKAKLSTNSANTAMVQRVGKNLAAAVESFLAANGMSSELSEYSWEFSLVQDNSANAFCMPGGKIVVYEGLLPITQDEASLAIVLGHEIAHAVAKHSAERLSKQMKAQYGSQILGTVLSGSSTSTQSIAQTVFGLGANYGVMMPFSRKQESEADRLGLIFAAMAGYDPSVATSFWQRMSAQGSSTPEFLSDHPSDATRIKNINGWLPEALGYYKGGATKTTTTKSKAPSTTKTFHIGTKK